MTSVAIKCKRQRKRGLLHQSLTPFVLIERAQPVNGRGCRRSRGRQAHRFFQDVEPAIEFLLADHQREQQADDIVVKTGLQQNQPMLMAVAEHRIGQRYRRRPPRFYRDQDVVHLMQNAAALPSAKKLRGRTFATLFGLLAVTGLRINEALHLDRSDVDLETGVLLIRRTKFGKSRLVPIHPTTQEALQAYGEARDRIIPKPAIPAFFLSERRTRITEWITRYTFAVVSRTVGLRPPTQRGRHGHGPRIHDLRHRFAAQTLIAWYRAGVDVERELPKLSTYLGHVHTADTYWYLEAVPELLQLAAERLTQRPAEVAP